jgi:hypothetical protein
MAHADYACVIVSGFVQNLYQFSEATNNTMSLCLLAHTIALNCLNTSLEEFHCLGDNSFEYGIFCWCVLIFVKTWPHSVS